MSATIMIEIGLLFLLIYTPLAFGGVTEYARMLLETVAGALFLVWIFREFRKRRRRPHEFSAMSTPRGYFVRLVPIPGMAAILSFFLIIMLQQVPLPASVVKTISPLAYQVHVEAALLTGTAIPRFLALSIYPQASASELRVLVAYLIIFFLVIQTIRTSQPAQRMIAVVISVGVLESGYGLFQMLSGKSLLPFYRNIPTIHGSFINKNHLAGYLEMVILLALGVLFTRFEKRPSRVEQIALVTIVEKYAKAFLWLLLFLVLFAGLVLSGSRGGILSAGGAIAFFALLSRSRHLLRRWVGPLFLIVPIALILIGVITPSSLEQTFKRFDSEEIETSLAVRVEIWKTSLHIFRDFPVFGSGLGTFPHLSERYQTFRWESRMAYSESDLLQYLAETGAVGVGCLAWLGMVYFWRVLALWKQQRSRRTVALVAGGLSALVTMLLHGGVDFNLHIPSNALLFTIIAALTYTLALTRESGTQR